MGTILVAVICNLVAFLILLSGVLGSIRNSWKLALLKFSLMIVGGVGAFFATPFLSEKFISLAVNDITIGSILEAFGVSVLTLNAIIYLIVFLLGYGITSITCNIFKHYLIKSYKNKSENKARIKRARSINPKAERLARKAAWRELRAQYRSDNRWFKRIISCFLNCITAIVVGLVVLMPFGYIGEDLNAANDGNKEFLEKGFDYTLNGIIDEKIEFKFFDWLVSHESDNDCEHSFVEGVCEICGEQDTTIQE